MQDPASKPGESPPPTLPTQRAEGGGGIAGQIVPLIPIVLAFGVAFIVAQIPGKPPRAHDHGEAASMGIALGEKAPDFTLRNAHEEPPEEQSITLSGMTDKSWVLLVFYQGYSCPKCMNHLRDIENAAEYFAKVNLKVLAISPWTLANTRDSIQIFGDFAFPLLSDPDAKIGKLYGAVMNDGTPGHGVFLIDKTRTVRFAETGEHPYDDIQGILYAATEMQKEDVKAASTLPK